jgi:membrane fusion protein, copper/silver efflux system
MKFKLMLAVIFIALISSVGGYLIGKKFSGREEGQSKTAILKSEKKILYYKDPMHPWITSDKPGKAPDCGMDLVPVYEGEEEMGDGIVKIDPVIVQNIGVKIEPVKKMKLTKTIRTVGRVDYDERKIAVITTKVSGWIEKLYVDYTGRFVKKGEPLFEIYSPELVTAQEEYLQALNYRESVARSGDPNIIEGANQLVENARKRLKYWDINEEQIKELENKKQVRKTLTLYSPVDGVVIEKNIFLGMKISQGMNLMKIADLSSMWIYADIYQYELPWIRVGEDAEVEVSYIPGKILKGKVVYIYPFLQPETKTIKVRLEFENPGYLLKPDMYVNVSIKSKVAINALAIPEQSVIRTGTRDIVVVALGGGRFKSVEVKLGVLADGYYQVLDGLRENENIVTSSHFLIDSESNLKSALSMLTHQHEDFPPQGAKDNKRQVIQEHKGHDMEHDETSGKFIDPVCGMEVEPDEELSFTYKGKKYYFCMRSDMEKFKANPEKYIKRK